MLKIQIHNLKEDIKSLEAKISNPTGFFKNKKILKMLELTLFEKRKKLSTLI
jgi:hypothetical protein